MRGKFSFLPATFVILALALAARGPARAQTPTWQNVTGNLANMQSECGNMSLVSAVPGSPTVIAGVAMRGLWANTSGTTWSQLGTGAGSATIINRPNWIVYDPLNSSTFWEAGHYNSGGVYKTTNGGTTFTRLGNITHNDYVSVDFTDANRQTLLAGGHEQAQTIYKSTNGGVSWTNIGPNFPANTRFTSYPHIINAQTYIVSSHGWGGANVGIYRTTNGGTSWQLVNANAPAGPPLVTSTGSLYWGNGGSLLRSTDSGATWTSVGSGLGGYPPVELPDKRLASISGGGNLVTSADGGATWSPITPAPPYRPWGFVYSAARQAFFIWLLDCGSVVQPNAVMKLDYPITGGGGTVPSAPTNVRVTRS
jgi:photosystem II stability/assembly factor-like uncharacterized protein